MSIYICLRIEFILQLPSRPTAFDSRVDRGSSGPVNRLIRRSSEARRIKERKTWQ